MALSYLTVAAMEERLGATAVEQLSGAAAGTPEADAWLTARGEETEAEIHGMIARRYATPLDLSGEAAAEALLRGYALDVFLVRAKRTRFTLKAQEKEAHDRALKYFRDVGAGKVVLPVASEPAASSVPDVQGAVDGPERTFTTEKLGGL